MDDKDKNNLRGLLKTCIKEASVYVYKEDRIIISIFPFTLLEKVVDLLDKKLRDILDVYDEMDIWFMICSKISQSLNYDELVRNISNDEDLRLFAPVDNLPDLLTKLKFGKIANTVIEELENPTISYSLVHLSNVDVGEHIRISKDIFIITDILQYNNDNYFNIDPIDIDIGTFNFLLNNDTTYLLIEQMGRNWRFGSSGQPLVFKNILQKLKSFLGLSIIKGILESTSISISESKKKSIPRQIGVFTSTEWLEGIRVPGTEPPDYDNTISEEHPDFNDILDAYSEGDELRRFCFQKRFFLADEINLPQVYVDLLNSLTITEYPTKPSLDLKGGKVLLFPHSQKLESPGQFLGKKFDKVRILLNSNDDYAERIKTASQWYLEGCCADNDTHKFIHYTIAIESLLGSEPKDRRKDNEDISLIQKLYRVFKSLLRTKAKKMKNHKKDIPLTQTLSDRFGFSLGKSLEERFEIRKDFIHIYDIRSRIVHDRKVILKRDDDEYLKKLEEMTKELISNAIDTYAPYPEEK